MQPKQNVQIKALNWNLKYLEKLKLKIIDPKF
jgi:hypothetical protein